MISKKTAESSIKKINPDKLTEYIQQFRYRKKKYFVQNFSDRRFSF